MDRVQRRTNADRNSRKKTDIFKRTLTSFLTGGRLSTKKITASLKSVHALMLGMHFSKAVIVFVMTSIVFRGNTQLIQLNTTSGNAEANRTPSCIGRKTSTKRGAMLVPQVSSHNRTTVPSHFCALAEVFQAPTKKRSLSSPEFKIDACAQSSPHRTRRRRECWCETSLGCGSRPCAHRGWCPSRCTP